MKKAIKKNKLALGTVQFGQNYGVSGGKQVSRAEVGRILSYAKLHGIKTLDTAIEYGDSEQALGETRVENFKVVTKLPAIPSECESIREWVKDSVKESLDRLRIPQLHGLLLHRSGDLLGSFGPRLYEALSACKEQGLVRKIGISVYDPNELDTILDRYQMDLLQAPFNVLDHRLETSGWMQRLHDSGVELHVRSVFLQGLLLMAPNLRPRKFKRWNKIWDEWHDWLEQNETNALKTCLHYALSRPQIKHVLVGVDNQKQLQEILKCLDDRELIPPMSFSSEDPELLNPSKWNLL